MKQLAARSSQLACRGMGLVLALGMGTLIGGSLACAGPATPAVSAAPVGEEISLGLAEQDETDVLELLRELELAVTNDDVEAVAALYAPDALWVQRDGSQVRGLAEVRKRYVELFEGFDVTLELKVASVTIDGSTARVLGNTAIQLRPRSGDVVQKIRDRFIMVLRHDASGPWRLWRFVWTAAS